MLSYILAVMLFSTITENKNATVQWRSDFAIRCTTGCTTVVQRIATTGCMYVYIMQPVVQPVVQLAVIALTLCSWLLNRLYNQPISCQWFTLTRLHDIDP
jgi:hypothetical protein